MTNPSMWCPCYALLRSDTPNRNVCRTLACRMNARLTSRFLSPFVFHTFYFFSSFLSFSLDSLRPLPLSFMFHCTLLDL